MDPLRDKQTDAQPWQEDLEKPEQPWQVVALKGGAWRVVSTAATEDEARQLLKEFRRQNTFKGFGIVGPEIS